MKGEYLAMIIIVHPCPGPYMLCNKHVIFSGDKTIANCSKKEFNKKDSVKIITSGEFDEAKTWTCQLGAEVPICDMLNVKQRWVWLVLEWVASVLTELGQYADF